MLPKLVWCSSVIDSACYARLSLFRPHTLQSPCFPWKYSGSTGAYKHAGRRDSYRPGIDHNTVTTNFAGIVCVAGEQGPLESTTVAGLAAPGPCRWGEREDRGCYTRAGAELWRTDGTSRGTRRVDDLRAGIAGSSPSFLTEFDGALFFAAHTDLTGTELFRRDEQSGSTYLVEVGNSERIGGYFHGGL